MRSPSTLTQRYVAFAAIAATLDIAAQAIGSTLYTGRYERYAAIAVGTLAGLAARYVLDSVVDIPRPADLAS